MLLTFSKDQFKDKILDGTKIHTIRTDKSERWKRGMKIHFWRGNPRNTNAKIKPHQFHESHCTSVQKIQFVWRTVNEGMLNEGRAVQVWIDGRNVTTDDQIIDALVKNDGFDSRKEFFEWFNEDFKGKLVHWTKLRY